MRLQVIAEHTVDLDRLQGGWVLDAGCRNFSFARQLAQHGCRVLALDADPTIEAPLIDGVTFLQRALSATDGNRSLVMTADPQARFVLPADADGVAVKAVTLQQLLEQVHATDFDLVKLDIEGSEYEVLEAWPGPIAGQISIEFHEHCHPQPPTRYDQIFAHLGQWYDVAQHGWTTAHGSGFNFWDTLLVRR